MLYSRRLLVEYAGHVIVGVGMLVAWRFFEARVAPFALLSALPPGAVVTLEDGTVVSPSSADGSKAVELFWIVKELVNVERFVFVWLGAITILVAIRGSGWATMGATGARVENRRGKIVRAVCRALFVVASGVAVCLIVIWGWLALDNELPAIRLAEPAEASRLFRLAGRIPEEIFSVKNVEEVRELVRRCRPVLVELEQSLSCPVVEEVPAISSFEASAILSRLTHLMFYAGELAERDGDFGLAARMCHNQLKVACVVDADVPMNFQEAMISEVGAAVGLHRVRTRLPGEIGAEEFARIVWGIQCRLEGLSSGEQTCYNNHFAASDFVHWQSRLGWVWSELTGEEARQREFWSRWEAQRRLSLQLILVEIAAEWYRHATGNYPRSVGDLLPQYLPYLPTDPFSGQPLQLRVTEGGCVAYGFGPDGDDDGGRPIDGWWNMALPDGHRPDGDLTLPSRPRLLTLLDNGGKTHRTKGR